MSETNSNSKKTRRKLRPALTPEARENQLIDLAEQRAEEQLRNGTASSQLITHYLKLGTMKARLENEKLIAENRLLQAKVEYIKSAQDSSELYAQALEAMKRYSGNGGSDEF